MATNADFNTKFALDNNAIQANSYSPAVSATYGRAGSLFIQVRNDVGAGLFDVWQKQDNGTTTNWIPFGGGGGVVPTWARETFVLTAPDIVNGYLQLANTAIDASVNPIVQGAGPLIGGSIAAGDDFEMSVVGTTRVTFSPGVVALWVVGQRVQIQYQF